MKVLDLLKVVQDSTVELYYNPSFKTDYESQFICVLDISSFDNLEDSYYEFFVLGYMDYLLSCDVVSVIYGKSTLCVFVEDSYHGEV